jgi:hypothetical protein
MRRGPAAWPARVSLVYRWPFRSVSAKWLALASFSRLAQPNLKNTYNLQANKWETYAIVFRARLTC